MVASVILVAPGANAALPYSDGDILLGFRATGSEGATTCYLVRLGSATQFTGASGPINVNLGSIKTDLETIFGVDWKTRADLFWGISGVQRLAGNGFPNNTMFASRPAPVPGTQSAPWTRPSAFGAGTPVGKLDLMSGRATGAGYSAGTSNAGGLDQTESGNVAGGLVQSTTSNNSYASFQPGGINTAGASSFGFFSGGIEGSFASGTAGSVLDFYKLEPGSGPAVLLGAFKLDDNGTLTFSRDISVFAPAATVGIEQPTYSVNEDAAGGQVAINLVRAGNAGTAFAVNFSTNNGSAVAGTDFTGQTNVAVSFAANETSKTVNVAIARRTGFQGNRQFGVAIASPTGNVSLGATSTATVSIIEVDPAPPSVAFSAASYPVNEDASQVAVTLTRTGDATAAFTVKFGTNNGSALAGTDFTGQTDVSVSFAANELSKTVNVAVTNRAGFQGNRSFTVTLSSPSGALLGGQASATVAIAEVDPQPSTLALSSATYTAAENVAGGVVPIVISRSGATTGEGSVTFSTADGSALAGTDYTAQTNVVVDFAANETSKTVNIAIANRTGSQPSRQFAVTISAPTNGGILGATATATVTITDKDTPPSGVIAGTYRGLIAPTGTPTNETTGAIVLSVTPTGAFTGRVHLGGGSLAFSGKFDAGGAAKFNPGATSALALKVACDTPLNLGTMTLTSAGEAINGETKNPGTTGIVRAERDGFDGLTPQTTVDAAFLANRGLYTAVLPSKAQGALATTAFPQGDGIGFVRVNKAGGVRFTGILADGEVFSATSALTKNYTCPIFSDLYRLAGSLSGNVKFQVQTNSDLAGTDWLWLRPIKARATHYPNGWPAGLRLDMAGASYAIPPASPPASVFPGLGLVDRVNGNALIEFADGKLTALMQKKANISTANIVSLVPPTDRTVSATITRATGLVAGSFRHSDRTRPAFRAVILQKGPNRGAFGYFLSTVPRGATTGESGGVSITPK